MKKVLLSQEIHNDAIRFLKDKGFVVEITPSPEDEVVRKYTGDADAIIVRTATKLSRDTIFSAKKLKVIARTGAGVDNIDVRAASERNIPVCNTPEANIGSVAEHTMAVILALSKYMIKLDSAVRENNFAIRNSYLPVDLQGKILGLVGFGRIGRKVAEKCHNCFSMKIVYFDPYISSEISVGFHCDRAENLEEVVVISDFVSIHIPYNEKNHHLINKEILEKMKSSAFLINTSRGGVVDEPALAEFLLKGKIAGAAVDVFENEPPGPDNPLLKLDNIILSPHSAALTKESSKRMAMHAAEGVVDVLEGRKPRWVYNYDKIKFDN